MTRCIEQLRDRRLAEEHALLREALDLCGWNQSATARHLGVSLSTVQRWVDRHGLRDEMRRRGLPRGRPATKKIAIEKS